MMIVAAHEAIGTHVEERSTYLLALIAAIFARSYQIYKMLNTYITQETSKLC